MGLFTVSELTGCAEQLVASVRAVVHDVAQFGVQVVQLGIDCITVFLSVGVVRCLGCEVFHAVHDVAHFVERAFRGLQQCSGIGDVTLCNSNTVGLTVHMSRDLLHRQLRS